MSLIQKHQMFVRSGRVTRFHNDETLAKQTNGEHSYACALIVYEIASKFINEVDPCQCAVYMLTHDIAETYTGDMPGPFKKENPGIYAPLEKAENQWLDKNLPDTMPREDHLSPTELLLCEFVDKYECLLTVSREIKMGNTLMEDRIPKFNGYLTDICARMREHDTELSNHLLDITTDALYDTGVLY